MQRRKLLALGAGAGLLLAAAGGALALLKPARPDGAFSPQSAQLMSAIATAVLGEALPTDVPQRSQALGAHLLRLQVAIDALPPSMQAEVDQLLTVLGSGVGRVGLVGLRQDWAEATPEQLSDAMQGMRASNLALRQQAYRALRDLTNAAYFAAPGTWQKAMGYPGPRAV